VVTSEGSGFAKPDPRILKVALDALGLSPAQALYVGDDVATDGGAAAGAGVAFCWMDRGRGHARGLRPPRRRVRNLLELPDLLPA
jgi:putative hydrolase of the HAD superfamily